MQDLKQIFQKRAIIISAIREFFAKEGFLEVDSPCLVTSPDTSPFNEVFETKTSNGKSYFLTPSPEFSLKKLISSGLKNIYQITKAFRDQQENDPLHLSEFTILEWYRDNATYLDLMDDCEQLILSIYNSFSSFRPTALNAGVEESLSQEGKRSLDFAPYQTVQGFARDDNVIKYQSVLINFAHPWQRISCKEAFEKYAQINLDDFLKIEKARKICEQHGYQVTSKNTWEELYHQVFLNEVEPKLPKTQPLILYDYPSPLAALSKIKETKPNYAERFEFYIGGLELGNGYSELTDSQEQEKRLKADIEIRKVKGMKVFDYDHELVQAVKNLPKTAGIAVGVDRLIMLFTDCADIHETTPLAI